VTAKRDNPPPTPTEKGFIDFEIRAWRDDAKSVRVLVHSSPAGSLKRPIKAPFSEATAEELRPGSIGGPHPSTVAVDTGRALSRALLQHEVYELLYRSVARAKADGARGLRLRLTLDPSLSDLPWEFLYRPELSTGEARSGFLLLDPFFSIVRGAESPAVAFSPVHGPQRLLFLGALDEQGRDIFDVETEFAALRKGTEKLGELLIPFFLPAADRRGIDDVLSVETPLFHYSGNTYVTEGQAYCVAYAQSVRDQITSVALGRRLSAAKVRVAVFMATESHASQFVTPILDAGVPVVIAFNGPGLTNKTSIEFCGALYRALAAGLSIDEAVGHGRSRLAALSLKEGYVDWGFLVLHMATRHAVPFPRFGSDVPRVAQKAARAAHQQTVSHVAELVETLDGDDYGALLSELSERGVLILGRFTDRRRKILEAIKQSLRQHPARYKPVLFTFDRPPSRDLVESIRWFAAASRFVIADLTEPKSVPAELQAIVPDCPSVPLVAIASGSTREYPLFKHIKRYKSVVETIVRYDGETDLLKRLDGEIIKPAETRRESLLADN
jgi:hypothetical protein